jgi:hypothetical protein
MVTYHSNDQAREVVKVAIDAIKKFTAETYELWVIDNASPKERGMWLLDVPGINVVLNQTTPRPPEARRLNFLARLVGRQTTWGSYAHGVGLEIGSRVVDQDCDYIMPLDMDVMPCRDNWLRFLLSKIDETTKAAGMLLHPGRGHSGTLHSMAYIVDFHLFKELGVDFLPDLPLLDDGDKTTVMLQAAGYKVFAARNTLFNPELVQALTSRDAVFRELHVDRAFDDEGNVIFLHLGRGVRKTKYRHHKGTSAQAWLRFAREFVLVS